MFIAECYRGKNILITGGSGTIGKALTEKLLRSCPDVGNIYLVFRSKKGKNIQERLEKMINIPLFDVLKKENPDAVKKLIPIAGDVQELGLGLNKEDKETIIKNVNIVFHVAASIRFDDSLVQAILINLRGTREAVNLALQINNILAFIHVSTGYCVIGEHTIIEEQMYPAPIYWKDAIILAEDSQDLSTSKALTEKYIHPLPNTYIFTKLLGEHVVNDLCKNRIPSVIIRPTLVNSTWADPIGGWTDSLNGLSSLILGVQTGMLRELCGTPDARPNCVPLDFVVRALILAGCKRVMDKNLGNVHIYNCCSDSIHKMTFRDLHEFSRDLRWSHPLRVMVWYPQFFYNPYVSLFAYTSFITNTIPAIILDALLLLTGNQTRAVKLSRKGYIAMITLQRFMSVQWIFKNDKMIELDNLIEESEIGKFSLQMYLNWSCGHMKEYLSRAVVVGAHYVLNTKYDKKRGLKLVRIMWALDRMSKIIIFSILCYIFYYQIYKYYKCF